MARGGLDFTYNPMNVAYGQPSKLGQAYVSSFRQGTQPSNAVRASGTSGYDPAYAQNLATFDWGQAARGPQPFTQNPFGPVNFGQPQGGGNAPTFGMPSSMLSVAGPQPGPQPAPKPTAPAPAQRTYQPSGWLADFIGPVGSSTWDCFQNMMNQKAAGG